MVENGELEIWSRNKNNITKKFPELTKHLPFSCKSGVFDSEIVCLNSEGKPNFRKVMGRLASTSAKGGESPARCMLFDCLKLERKEVLAEPFTKRKSLLGKVLQPNRYFALSEVFEDGPALYEGIKGQDLEGIVAKVKSSLYLPGKRTRGWIKVKNRKTVDCVITGYSLSINSRAFSSVRVGEVQGNQLIDRGSVGSGFSEKALLELKEVMDLLMLSTKGDKVTITPKIACEIEYAEVDSDGSFRAPVLKRIIGQWEEGKGIIRLDG